MNILFVSDVSISEVTGGAERVLFEQSTRLQKRGHDVHILTRKLPDHISDQVVIQGVKEWRYDVDQRNAFLFMKSTWLNSKSLFEVLHNKYKFDCINLHQPFSALGVVRSPLSKKIKKIYTCHSLSFEEFKTRNPEPEGLIKKNLYFLNLLGRKYIEKRILDSSDQVIVLSEFIRNRVYQFHGITGRKIKMIPGGVDLEKFCPVHDKMEIRKRLNIPGKRMILLTVRNLVPRMGLENLIITIKEVVNVAPYIYLVLGGDGPLKKDLIALTKQLGMENFIRFEGFIQEEQLPAYYQMADLFVLSTLKLEGFGLVTLEALASGVPVLGTPVGGTVEILERLDPRYLFKDTKPVSMASLIIETCQRFRNNPRFWQDVSSQCRAFVEENYSWEKNVDALEGVLEGVFEVS